MLKHSDVDKFKNTLNAMFVKPIDKFDKKDENLKALFLK